MRWMDHELCVWTDLTQETVMYVMFHVSDLPMSDPYDAKQLTHLH